ncbi:hypothetical protein CsSME_00053564 [Camellia sinensis var. sinensis]
MAKFASLLLLALLAISMVATTVLAADAQYHLSRNAHHNAKGGVAKHNTRNHACSSATNVAQSACVFPLAIMGTRVCALATTTGRPREEAPSALKL